MLEGPPDQVVLDFEVMEEEVDGVGRVGSDPADLRGGDDDVFGPRIAVEGVDGVGIAEVELGAGTEEQVPVPGLGEKPGRRRPRRGPDGRR